MELTCSRLTHHHLSSNNPIHHREVDSLIIDHIADDCLHITYYPPWQTETTFMREIEWN